MRPALKPGLVPLWRNRDTLQIGVDPRRAVALTGMRGTARLLHLLDGSRDRGQVVMAARELGIGAEATDRVLALLAAGGALDDVPAPTSLGMVPAARARLAPEVATAALAHGDTDGGARTLARRHSAQVRVQGVSRTGLAIAWLLNCAGIGQVTCAGPLPGTGGRYAWRRAAGVPRPDLVVLADWHDRDLPAMLGEAGIPHLTATASEAIGVVGPLVRPGSSACLRCLDMARADRDPAWPLLLAQLAVRPADPPTCDAVLATAVAAQTAGQVLAFIDRGDAPVAVTNGTLELVLPSWQWRRRTWEPHPRCGCGSRCGS